MSKGECSKLPHIKTSSLGGIMLEHNGTIFNAHRYAITVDRSVTGVHVLQELTDNSIQYNSDETWVIVDSFKNRVITADTGTGIPKDIFQNNYL